MVNILPWMITYYVCLFCHIVLVFACLYGFIAGAVGFSGQNHVIFFWASLGITWLHIGLRYSALNAILKLEKPCPNSTIDEQRFKQKHTLFLALVLDAAYVVVEISFARIAGPRIVFSSLYFPVFIFATLALISTIATTVVDLLKLRSLHQQSIDVEDVLNSLEPYQDEPEE
ncbi:hypothetical protein PT974_12579 [Cladobotryum mycophilum]|uniref:Uncharacterized protein n=1 Tax=Cladobotryum mycophilum TaxID=491253 RepID=A0ABR0S8D5_9HYPO